MSAHHALSAATAFPCKYTQSQVNSNHYPCLTIFVYDYIVVILTGSTARELTERCDCFRATHAARSQITASLSSMLYRPCRSWTCTRYLPPPPPSPQLDMLTCPPAAVTGDILAYSVVRGSVLCCLGSRQCQAHCRCKLSHLPAATL